MNNPTKTTKASAPETRTLNEHTRKYGRHAASREVDYDLDAIHKAAQSPEWPWNNYIAMEKEAVLYRNHADKLAETLQWIRKYPDVLEDKFYTRCIDERLAEYQNAKGGQVQ